MMRERDFAGRWIRIAAEEPGIARSVMRRAEWAACDEGLAGAKQTNDAVNLGCFERFFQGQWWKDCGEPLGEHRFAGAGRADQQDVVTARSGDFEGAFDGFLPLYFSEIEIVLLSLVEQRAQINFGGSDLLLPFQKRGGFAQVGHRNDIQAGDDRGFGGIFGRNENTDPTISASAQRNGQHAFDGPDRAGQRQLADDGEVFQLVGFDLLGGGSNSDGDGQVEAGAFLFYISGREIDGDTTQRNFEPGIREGGADPVARLFDRGVRQTNNDDDRIAPTGVDLDFNRVRFNPINGR